MSNPLQHHLQHQDQLPEADAASLLCRGRIPEWVHIPAGVAIPFGAFDAVLQDEVNADISADFVKAAGFDGAADANMSNLQSIKAIIQRLRAPDSLKQQLLRSLSDEEGVTFLSHQDQANVSTRPCGLGEVHFLSPFTSRQQSDLHTVSIRGHLSMHTTGVLCAVWGLSACNWDWESDCLRQEVEQAWVRLAVTESGSPVPPSFIHPHAVNLHVSNCFCRACMGRWGVGELLERHQAGLGLQME